MKKPILIVLGLLSLLLLSGVAYAEGVWINPTPSGVPVIKTKLATPVLVSPENNTHLFNYPRVTTLIWRPVPNADQFIVEIARREGTQWVIEKTTTISAKIPSGKFSSTSFTYTYRSDNDGRWRVTAVNSSGWYWNSDPSAYRVFYYKTKTDLPAPVLVSPVNNTQFYHYPRITTVTWKPVQGATGYKIEIQEGLGFGAYWSSSITDTILGPLNTAYTFRFVGAQPGRWRVSALNSDGLYYNSAPSEYRTFTYHL
jgi:hypothetical protein